MVIPLAFGLVGEDGRDRPLLDEDGRQVPAVITLDAPQATVTFSGHPTGRCSPSTRVLRAGDVEDRPDGGGSGLPRPP